MKVKVNTGPTQKVVSVGIQGPSGVTTISDARDVDATLLENGSVLVYNIDSLKWTSTKKLDQQVMEAGEY